MATKPDLAGWETRLAGWGVSTEDAMGLARATWLRYCERLPPQVDRQDMLTAAVEGLILAVNSYDATRGAKWSTWATSRVQWSMVAELRRQDPLAWQARKAEAEPVAVLSMEDPGVLEAAGILSVEDQVLTEEDARRIRDAVACLPGLERALVEGLYFAGATRQQLQASLSLTPREYQTLEADALARLRRVLDGGMMAGRDGAAVRLVPLDAIDMSGRRREEMGDIDALARSIERYGLLNPIVVDGENRLLSGGRRVVAFRQLGRAEIPARDWGTLTEEERRQIELEENTCRKDLTSYEQSRSLVTQAPAAASGISTDSVEIGRAGRRSDYAVPKKVVARALGVSTTALVEAEQHVETAKHFPFMQRSDWKQSHVLQARALLEEIPEPEAQGIAAEMISQPNTPPRAALGILANLANMPAGQRRELASLYRSEDQRDRNEATMRAAAPEARNPAAALVSRFLHEFSRQFPAEPYWEAWIGEGRRLLRETG